MKESIFAKRINSLRQRLVHFPFQNGTKIFPDAFWIIQPENRRYLSGFKACDSSLTESSGSLFISKSRRLLVTDSRYTLEAEKEVIDFEVQTLKKDLIEEFPEIIRQIGTNNLGFEEHYLTCGLYRKISERIESLSSPVGLVPVNMLVEKMREIKDETEVKALSASAEMISEILSDVIEWLQPGLTEKQVAWRIESLAKKRGAEGLAFPSIVASGPNGALPHAIPTNRELQMNEPVILDVGVMLDGYCSDMTRTVFLGEPEAEFKEIYSTVHKAQLTSLKEVRSGVMSDYPDSIARQIIKNAGFGQYFGHSLGHGVGLATHEGPRLGPRKPVKLKKGMVVTVEPGIYIPGKGGVRLEEMVVIEDEGSRILTTDRHFYDFGITYSPRQEQHEVI